MTDEEPIWRPDEIAREIWTWKAHRSDKETLAQLKELGPDFQDITIKDIRYWKKAYNWATLADNAIRQLAPSIHNEMIGGLIIAGLKAQRALDGILEEWTERKQAPPKEVVQMLDMTFRYAGASPVGIKDPTQSVRAGRGGRTSSMVAHYLTEEEIENEGREVVMLPEFSSEENDDE